jgi:conjugal transfer pilus assembly protein TraV
VIARAATLAGLSLLAGCMNLSGLSGSSSYACKAPDGVTCQSVSGTYANAVADNLPAQRQRAVAPPAVAGASASAASAPRSEPPSAGATPLRSPPRILRLWFKPWEDADRDLYDQGYVYVQIDAGRWLVEHSQRAIREANAPVRAPAARAPEPPPRDAATRPQRPAGLDNLIPGLPPRAPSPAPSPASGDSPD